VEAESRFRTRTLRDFQGRKSGAATPAREPGALDLAVHAPTPAFL
jgi:hypothetical protein